MNTKHFISRICIIAALVVLVVGLPSLSAGATSAGTAFTYQGQLTQGGDPFTGSCNFQFGLWDSLTGGTQVGSTTTLTGVTVTNGLFTVQLDFGASPFTGSARWLEIGVECGSETLYTTLAPRQELTPAPYALYAPAAGNAATVTNGVYTSGSYSNPAWLTSLAGSKISGAVASATSATNFSGSLAGDVTGMQGATSVTKLRGVTIASTAPVSGQVLQYNGSQWAPTSAQAFLWSLIGNSGTNPLTNFLGTLDNVALEFKVNNSRALRLEPNATSPNILGGYSGNWVMAGVAGAVISGGGVSGGLNRVTDDYGVVGGGANNQAGDNAGTTSDHDFATVGGGRGNTASGAGAFIGGGGYDGTTINGNTAAANAATIGGGFANQVIAGADYATVGGGSGNTADGNSSTVGGGASNIASNIYATVGGGWGNTSSSNIATVGGGYSNAASGNVSTIGGGESNATSSDYATVGGGGSNTAGGPYSTVGGGAGNTASGAYSTIGGGADNTASRIASTVAGGLYAAATHYGEMAHASGRFASNGDAQASEYVLRNMTTDGTQTELFLDGISASQRITLASNRTLTFDILIVAHSSTGGNSAGYQIKGLIENDGGTTAFVGTPTVTVLGEDVPAWDVSVTADNTNKALAIWVTGLGSTTIRWVASVRTVEVNY